MRFVGARYVVILWSVVQPAERKIEESKLVLEGLVQHYLVVNENDKSRHLVDLLDNLDFNQVSSTNVVQIFHLLYLAANL